jgi:hypothetical protein
MYKPNTLFLVCLVAYCVIVKVAPFAIVLCGFDIPAVGAYPWSFTPVFAFALFGMGTFRDMRLAVGLPVLAWVLADVLIGLATGLEYGFREGLAFATYPSQLTNYLGLLVVCGCGLLIRQTSKVPSLKIPAVAFTAVLGPTLFFLVSNLGVWYFDVGIGYARNMAGLQEAYVKGIPFYQNQLISTVVFSALLFSPLGMSQMTLASRELLTRRSEDSLVGESAVAE